MTTQIIVDVREFGLIKELEKKYEPDKFSNYYKSSALEIGDIHLVLNGDIVLIIERKTISDLYASIKDGRYKEQKCRLLSNYPLSKVLYIVEGNMISSSCKRINKEIVYGSIVNTLLRDSIRILQTSNISETSLYISLFLKRLLNKPDFFLKEIEGGNILEYSQSVKINKQKNMTPELCQLTQLAQIPGMSVTSAKYILDKYISLKGLIKAYELEVEKEGNPELMLASIDCKSRKLGKVVSKRIYEYIFI